MAATSTHLYMNWESSIQASAWLGGLGDVSQKPVWLCMNLSWLLTLKTNKSNKNRISGQSSDLLGQNL